MKEYIAERVTEIATYLLENKCTVREVAAVYCVSKSTAHKDLSERLPQIDKQLYKQICDVLAEAKQPKENINKPKIKGTLIKACLCCYNWQLCDCVLLPSHIMFG